MEKGIQLVNHSSNGLRVIQTVFIFKKKITMKKFFKELLSDESGVYSSKRLGGLLCVLALVVALVANTFTHNDIRPAEYLVDAVALFAFGALGLTSIDKLSRIFKKK